MEKTYSFEIHFDGEEFETLMGAESIVDAIFNVMKDYKEAFGVTLVAENFILLGEI